MWMRFAGVSGITDECFRFMASNPTSTSRLPPRVPQYRFSCDSEIGLLAIITHNELLETQST
jgi:hypothetical protein